MLRQYRIVVPDLPSHGRSSGLHSYVSSMDLLADAVHAVICDVLHHDQAPPFAPPRKVFVAGQSEVVTACLRR
jgi:acylglycerol lipase